MKRRLQLIGTGLILSTLSILLVLPTTHAQEDSFGARGEIELIDASLPNYPVTEDFDDITMLVETGWAAQNNSTGPGTTNWFQGNDSVISAHAGDPTAYIGANFNSTDGGSDLGSGVISNWLMTPTYTFSDGDTISFWTRTVDGSIYPDRLQIRLSLAGESTNVGTLPTDVGDFDILLDEINRGYVVDPTEGGYPQEWTQYEVTISGVGRMPTSGRVAFRYFVESAGPLGSNSNYIGLDSFLYTGTETAVTVSEVDSTSVSYLPMTVVAVFIGLGVASVAVRRHDQI